MDGLDFYFYHGFQQITKGQLISKANFSGHFWVK